MTRQKTIKYSILLSVKEINEEMSSEFDALLINVISVSLQAFIFDDAVFWKI